MEQLLLVGRGAMGAALYQGWSDSKNTDIWVIDPHGQPSERVFRKREDLPKTFQPTVIIFAIKPQKAVDVLPLYASFKQPGTLFVSVMSGLCIARLTQLLGPGSTVVRCMPNLPVAFGQGAIGLFNPSPLSGHIPQRLTPLFEGVGQVCWVEQEDHLNIITSLSGSGPAYLFYLAETMAGAAHKLGLPLEISQQLARQTLIGSGEMAKSSPLMLEALRQKVTSLKGTTAAGIAVLQDQQLENLVLEAMTHAYRRAKELS